MPWSKRTFLSDIFDISAEFTLYMQGVSLIIWKITKITSEMFAMQWNPHNLDSWNVDTSLS